MLDGCGLIVRADRGVAEGIPWSLDVVVPFSSVFLIFCLFSKFVWAAKAKSPSFPWSGIWYSRCPSFKPDARTISFEGSKGLKSSLPLPPIQ